MTVDLGTTAEQGDGWRRMHPLSPLFRGTTAVVAASSMMINAILNNDSADTAAFNRAGGVWLFLLGLGVVLVLAVAYSWVWWLRTRFRIGEESVELTTGVLVRRHRSMRLDQLEAIDIVHPMVARLFGLAQLKLESAGGADSHLLLSYLTARQAEEVRSQILTRRLGPAPINNQSSHPSQTAPPEPNPYPSQTAPAGPNPYQPLAGQPRPLSALTGADPGPRLFQVPLPWTIRAYLRTWQPWLTLLASAGSLALVVTTGKLGGAIGLIAFLGGLLRGTWKYLVTEMGFAAYAQPGGIHLRHGLLTQVNQSLPTNRIQAVRLLQRRWWRGPDWWRIELNIAGYGTNQDEQRTVLVPVADPAMAATALTAVLPGFGAIWEVVDQAMHATGPTAGFVCSPPQARFLDPLAWRRQGYARCAEALILRGGALTRTVTIVPDDRVQGVSVDDGPLQRHHGLASLTLHSTHGPVVAQVNHLATADIARLLADEVPLIDRAPGRTPLDSPPPDNSPKPNPIQTQSTVGNGLSG